MTSLLDFDPIYLVWLFIAVSVGLTVEAVYLTAYSAASYRSKINRRLMLSKDRTDRESVLIELRRERGLSSGGHYRLDLTSIPISQQLSQARTDLISATPAQTGSA